MKIGFCSSPRFVEHQTGRGHPERPDRIRAIYAALHRANLISANPFPDFNIDLGKLHQFQNKLIELDFQSADTKWIAAIHPQKYIDHIRRVCEAGGGIIDQGDTLACPTSYEIARLAVGAVLRSCDAVMSGEVDRSFSAVRPPGHHAEPDRPMGFCLFANLAIGAKYLQQHYGLKRIAIVDFDVHHGNGTQACFDHDPGVYFFSLHQHPYTLYPGSGHDWEIGTGPGRGYTLNIGFNPGSGDAEYLSTITERVIPTLEKYQPEILMISAGFDAHQDDPLAQIELSEEGYELMTRALVQFAEHCCAGRIVSVLEGGYNLRALGRSVVRHLAGLGAT